MNAITTSLILFILVQPAWSYDPAPRWAQAQMLISDSLFVYGGKTDQFNSYSYTGAPSTNEFLLLPLSAPFEVSSPPWILLASSANTSTPQGPPIAWSTLSATNTSMGLLLGGIADPNSDISVQTRADSSILVDVYDRLSPQLSLHPPTPYPNEPARRMQHATCSSSDGRVFVIGGLSPDGSGRAFSQHFVFDASSSPTFTALSSETGPPDVYGHACIMLPNGYLLVFGGLSPSSGGLVAFDVMWALDTSQTHNEAAWFTLSVDTANLPSPRRDFAATLLSDGRILVHGGQDAMGQTVYGDGWILNLNGSDGHAVWTFVEALSQLGQRRDHLAVVSGEEVIFGFGYGSSSPAPAALEIYNAVSSSFVHSHTPPATFPTLTIPGPSQTPTTAPSPTLGSGGGHSGTVTRPNSVSNTAVHPTNTLGGGNGGGNGNDGGSTIGDDKGSGNNNVSAIVIGAALGAVAIFLVVGCAIWYYRRRSRQEWERAQFSPLGDSEDGDISPGSGNNHVLGTALVGAAAVGTAAGLPNEKEPQYRMRGGAGSNPNMPLSEDGINELRNLPHLRAVIYNNISNASFATPLVPPSPTSSLFNSTHHGGAVGRGMDAVTGAVTAGVATLASMIGISVSSQRRRYNNNRPLPSRLHTPPERRDMLADEDTRDFDSTGGPAGHLAWGSAGSSNKKGLWGDYQRRRAEGSAGSTWSLMSVFGAGGSGVKGLWTRDPSSVSRGSSRSHAGTPWGTPWNEKGDPFDGDWQSAVDEQGYVSVRRAGSSGRRPMMAREYSNASSHGSMRYVDPFADPVQEESRGDLGLGAVGVVGGAAIGAYSGSRNAKDASSGDIKFSNLNEDPPSLPPIRTVLPPSQLHPQPLSPLSEHPSQPSLLSQSQHQLDLSQSQTLSQSSHATQNIIRSRADSTGSSFDTNQVLSPFERPSSSHTSFGAHAQEAHSYATLFDKPPSPSYLATPTSYVPNRPSSISNPPSDTPFQAPPTTLLSVAPTQPMRRSDTWWARFSRTRFLDRRSSDASRRVASGGMIDIRDPNPPPRLNPIEENQHSGSPSGSAGAGGSAGSREKPRSDHDMNLGNVGVGRRMSYGRSTSSLQTTRTVDSEALERLGGTMNVVQRTRDASGSADSGNNVYRWSRADTISTNESDYEADVAALANMFKSPLILSDDEDLPLTTSPKITNSPLPLNQAVDVSSPITPHSGARSASVKPLSPRPPSGGNVASRVAAYEKRMSQDYAPKSPKTDEGREHKKRVDYGLVPRPSLFVANPDSRRGSSNDS